MWETVDISYEHVEYNFEVPRFSTFVFKKCSAKKIMIILLIRA